MSEFYYEQLPAFIKELYANDATVHAYITMALRNKINYTEILEKLVVSLAQEKKDLINTHVEAMQNSTKHIILKG